MGDDDLHEILTSYKWIKVKRYVEDPTASYDVRYGELLAHHQKETEFLIGKVRELAVLVVELERTLDESGA